MAGKVVRSVCDDRTQKDTVLSKRAVNSAKHRQTASPSAPGPSTGPNPLDPSGIAGRHFGAWTAVKADATGRRILCTCCCGTVREIGCDALLSGESTGC